MADILMIISDILSIITVSLCFILKVPQIIKIYKSGNASGLSLNALLFELSSYIVTMLYNYTNNHALLTYSEYHIIIIQEYIVIAFVLKCQNYKLNRLLIIIVVSLFFMLCFAYGIFSKDILTFLLPFTTPVSALSKIMQLIEILRSKNAKSVSALTWFLSCFTNLTRIYTVYMDSADVYLLLNFSVSSILSASVLLATLYYQMKMKSD